MIGDLQLDQWLAPERVRVALGARGVEDVIAASASLIARTAGIDSSAVNAALLARIGDGGYAIGDGVAVPHAEVDGLERPIGALVITAEGLDVGALDGAPADIFFTVVAPPGDPVGHLQLLADLAILSRSPLLRAALRRAGSAEEIWSLLEAAAPRQLRAPTTGGVEVDQLLAVIAIAGENAVDALLVELLAQGFDAASVLDAQTLQDAAASEVPLFADFRGLFGDPGGRRIFILEMDSGKSDWLIETVEKTCEERKASGCNIAFMPLTSRWQWRPAKADKGSSGH